MTAPESTTSARKIIAGERDREAAALRKAGATYTQIAEKLGVSLGCAHNCVRRSMARAIARATEDIEIVRRLDLDRLDTMLLALWPQATHGNFGAIDRVLKIMERRARLLGEDAPVRQEVTGKDGGPIEFSDAERAARIAALVAGIEKAGAGSAADGGDAEVP